MGAWRESTCAEMMTITKACLRDTTRYKIQETIFLCAKQLMDSQINLLHKTKKNDKLKRTSFSSLLLLLTLEVNPVKNFWVEERVDLPPRSYLLTYFLTWLLTKNEEQRPAVWKLGAGRRRFLHAVAQADPHRGTSRWFPLTWRSLRGRTGSHVWRWPTRSGRRRTALPRRGQNRTRSPWVPEDSRRTRRPLTICFLLRQLSHKGQQSCSLKLHLSVQSWLSQLTTSTL